MYKPKVLITRKRKQLSTRSKGLLQCLWAFQVRLRSSRQRRLQKTVLSANFRFGYCFYFRFGADVVLQSRTMSVPVDRACPKTVSYLPVTNITTSGFRPPSWIYRYRKCKTRVAWIRRKNLRTKIVWISSELAQKLADILLGAPHRPNNVTRNETENYRR